MSEPAIPQGRSGHCARGGCRVHWGTPAPGVPLWAAWPLFLLLHCPVPAVCRASAFPVPPLSRPGLVATWLSSIPLDYWWFLGVTPVKGEGRARGQAAGSMLGSRG